MKSCVETETQHTAGIRSIKTFVLHDFLHLKPKSMLEFVFSNFLLKFPQRKHSIKKKRDDRQWLKRKKKLHSYK